jgi:hypothetical protein
MQVSVLKLRKRGMRLRKVELGEPLVGNLQIGDAGQTSFCRPVLKAELWLPTFSSTLRPLDKPLFDARLLHMSGAEFSLAGIELEAADGRLFEFAQVWRCSLITGAEATVPPRVDRQDRAA